MSKLTSPLTLGATLAMAAMTAPGAVQAHGAPEYPIARVYNCYKNPTLPACQAAITAGGPQAIYDWNGVNQGAAHGNHQAVVPDGQLCAGGQTKFRGFDLARGDWPATAWSPAANGKYEFRYNATAPHRTLHWKFYLTRQGWNPAGAPLKWSDMDLVEDLGPDRMVTSGGGKTYTMALNLPARTGKHVLYSVWQRSDSGEAFYGCSDVDFGGEDRKPVVVPSAFKQIGQVSAQQDLPAQSTVKLRVFDRNGGDLETHALTLSAAAGKAAWLQQVATLANGRSAYLQVGSLQGGTVTVPSGVSVMDVYLRNADSGATYALDVALPPTATGQTTGTTTGATTGTSAGKPTTAPVADGEWVEGRSFTRGQVVTHKGRNYRCIQSHTAWKGAGWSPDAAGVVNVLWQPL